MKYRSVHPGKYGSKPLALPTVVRMIDMLSSTLARAAWPGVFTAMVRAGARNSAEQVLLPVVQTKASQLPARSPSTARYPEERDVKATHKRRRPAHRHAVQVRTRVSLVEVDAYFL